LDRFLACFSSGIGALDNMVQRVRTMLLEQTWWVGSCLERQDFCKYAAGVHENRTCVDVTAFSRAFTERKLEEAAEILIRSRAMHPGEHRVTGKPQDVLERAAMLRQDSNIGGIVRHIINSPATSEVDACSKDGSSQNRATSDVEACSKDDASSAWLALTLWPDGPAPARRSLPRGGSTAVACAGGFTQDAMSKTCLFVLASVTMSLTWVSRWLAYACVGRCEGQAVSSSAFTLHLEGCVVSGLF
jgi:hypothetical protein